MADKTRPTTAFAMSEGSTGSTLGTVLRTAARATPVVAVAAAAPAFAASTSSVSVRQQVTRRNLRSVLSTGSVTNDTPVDQAVTLTWTWTWTVSSGGTIESGSTRAESATSPWKIVYNDFVPETENKSYRLAVTRVVAPGATVGFPNTDIFVTSEAVTGIVTAELSVAAPVEVVQSAPVDGAAFTLAGG